jgi:hypothetical protein
MGYFIRNVVYILNHSIENFLLFVKTELFLTPVLIFAAPLLQRRNCAR